jgi:STE24 endopeptidase
MASADTHAATDERAREYSRLKETLALTGTALDLLSSATFLAAGGARALNSALLPSSRPSWTRRLGYHGSVSALGWLAGLPLGFYSGYVVEQRFELSNQPPLGWAIDTLKGKAISLPLEVAVLEGVYLAIGRWPRRWWLVCAGAVIPLTAGLAQLFPVLIAPRFNRYEPLQDAELAARLTTLTDKAGIAVAGVLQMDMSRRTSKANAFFTGIGPTKRIVLSDTLLEQFSPDEIEGVVAHEAGHQAHRDIWRFVALSGVMTLASAYAVDLLATRALRAWPNLTGTSQLSDRRSLPVLGLAFSLIGLALAPAQLAYSRRIERKADRYAIELTKQPRAYANAMRQLATSNLADPQPPRLITWLLHSHPPLAERIAAAERAQL